MGFGMRKEVYTRKPKKAFKKIKETYGEPKLAKESDEKYHPGKQYTRTRFKHFYQTRTWKIGVWSLIGFFVLMFLSITFIEPLYWDYKQNQFEEKGIYALYNHKKHVYDKAAIFFIERKNKIYELEDRFLGIQSLIIQNLSIDTDSDSLVYWRLGNKSSSAYITNGVLTFSNDSLKEVVDGNWRCSLSFKSINELHPSIFEYLNTSRDEMKSIIGLLEHNKFNINSIKNGFEIIFSVEQFGRYSFQYTSRPFIEKGVKKDHFRTGKIRDGVFWVKYDRVYLSDVI